MENPGLITFGSSIMLPKPDERNIRLERGYLSVAAHEIGHIWFGDLVTMAWWDDLWLNEAFASWIAAKIVDEWHPEWDGSVSRVQSRSGVMGNDALMSARRIRQPIDTAHDIENAFDGITYTKGASIISMFESFVGEDRFREGVRSYLRQHAYGNAPRLRLPESGRYGGRPAGGVRGGVLDLPRPARLPAGHRRAQLRKGPARPPAAEPAALPAAGFEPAAPTRRWQVPVCARFPEGRACTLLTDGKGELALAGAKGCPRWVLANADGVGYYRVQYKGDLLARLLRDGGKALTVAERVGLIGDVGALVRSGRMMYGEALELVPALARDDNRHILASAAALVGGLADHYVPESLRPQYRKVDRRELRRARPQARLGAPPGRERRDPPAAPRAGGAGGRGGRGHRPAGRRAPAGRAVARPTARRSRPSWWAPSCGRPLAAATGRLWEKLYAAAKVEKDRRDRTQLLQGMGGFSSARSWWRRTSRSPCRTSSIRASR